MTGRTARTYTTKRNWERLRFHLEPEDIVVLAFGNNDDVDPRWDEFARGSIVGWEGDSINATVVVKDETVYTYRQ